MNVVRLALVLATGGTFTVAAPGTSQTTDSAAKSHAPAASDQRDTLFLRARRLVAEGNGAAGRALVDFALATTAPRTTEFATALYWRGAMSSTAADAERDYRRIIVEYPFSPHSGDALLALAQLEMARGDRDPAIDHLQRFLLQRPNAPERARAGLWLRAGAPGAVWGGGWGGGNRPVRGWGGAREPGALLGAPAGKTVNRGATPPPG